MKLLILSDTHRKIDKALEACNKVYDADAIIHLGDHKDDAIRIAKATDRQVEWVNGNCDFGSPKDDYKVLVTEWGNIYLCHGHKEDVKYQIHRLLYRAEELGCKAAFFGHTHMAGYEEINGIHVLNPGSISQPRDGSKGTYAVVELTPTGFHANIIYL